MKRLLNYFVNGKGIGLLAVLGCALLYWGGSSAFFYKVIKSFLNQPETGIFLEQLPTVEIKDGQIIAPILSEEKYSFPITGGKTVDLVVNTQITDKPNIDFEQGLYITANALYLKQGDSVEALNFDPTINRTITPEAFKDMLIHLNGTIGILMGVLPALVIVLGFIIVYLFALACGILVNSALTFSAWGRIASFSWILTVVGFTGVFLFTKQLNVVYVVAFAVVLSLIFAIKCHDMKNLSVK